MTLRVACLLYDGFQLLDLAGPTAVFEVAGHRGAAGYEITLVGAVDGTVTSSGGVNILVRDHRDYPDCDILFVPGGFGASDRANYEDLLWLVRKTAREGRRLVSVSSGAFILAEAGILDGRRVVTHWGPAVELARRFPSIDVDAESLFHRDDRIWTSAGINSGIDVALAIVEEDYGPAVAMRVAEVLVVPYRRSASQSQHPTMLSLARVDDRFAGVLAWARDHLAEPLPIDRLAAHAALSVRQFTRVFRASTGSSPARAIERLRVDHARAAIESGARILEEVAMRSGFENAERMRRAFIRVLGETPQSIRRRQIAKRYNTKAPVP